MKQRFLFFLVFVQLHVSVSQDRRRGEAWRKLLATVRSRRPATSGRQEPADVLVKRCRPSSNKYEALINGCCIQSCYLNWDVTEAPSVNSPLVSSEIYKAAAGNSGCDYPSPQAFYTCHCEYSTFCAGDTHTCTCEHVATPVFAYIKVPGAPHPEPSMVMLNTSCWSRIELKAQGRIGQRFRDIEDEGHTSLLASVRR